MTKKYKRILLKLSGEALMGDQDFGIDSKVLDRVGAEIKQLIDNKIEVALVIGGGNIFRGMSLAASGMNRTTGDHMGMLATVINALALQDAIEHQGLQVRVMSALAINQVCENYIRRRAVRHLEKGRVVIFAAGTGNPFFTTDTAASLRGTEIGADIVLKGTKVDGIYTADPMKDASATMYETLGYDQVIEQKLAVMDTTAMVLCRDNNIPIRVFNMNKEGLMLRIALGEAIGTLVE